MSWSMSVGPVDGISFAEALANAVPNGQTDATAEVIEQVAAAKMAAAAMFDSNCLGSMRLPGVRVGCNMVGHAVSGHLTTTSDQSEAVYVNLFTMRTAIPPTPVLIRGTGALPDATPVPATPTEPAPAETTTPAEAAEATPAEAPTPVAPAEHVVTGGLAIVGESSPIAPISVPAGATVVPIAETSGGPEDPTPDETEEDETPTQPLVKASAGASA